ncbi:hypothetical protein [Collimonas silvisoli]|uniref:hypothetical protein n=1 Tax=Collimonas silvisoli TaxID=2825884 RepID=UPI001B8D8728|nr:hypothetical protein [Collimonas silvisoli]
MTSIKDLRDCGSFLIFDMSEIYAASQRKIYIISARQFLPFMIQRWSSPDQVGLDLTQQSTAIGFSDGNHLLAAAFRSAKQGFFFPPEKGSKMMVFGEENESEFE